MKQNHQNIVSLAFLSGVFAVSALADRDLVIASWIGCGWCLGLMTGCIIVEMTFGRAESRGN